MIRRSLDKNGDYAINRFVADSPATIQAVHTRLRLFLGELFLNTSAGVPYYQKIFVKPARLSEIEQVIKSTILNTEGIDTLSSFDMNFDAGTRALRISFSGKTIYNDEFNEVIGINPIGV